MPDLWFFFQRRENRDFVTSDENEVVFEIDQSDMGITEEDLEELGPIETLRLALEKAREMGVSKGSHRSGCFQVQSSLGVWKHLDGKRMDPSTPGKASKIVFRTWEQLEAEETSEEMPK